MGKYGRDDFNNVYGADTISTPRGRFAWPYLVTPKPVRAGMQGKPRYEVTLVLPKDDPKVKTFLAAVRKEAKPMFEEYNKDQKTKILFDPEDIPNIQDGDNFDAEKYPYYANSWVICPKNVRLPQIVNADKEPIEGSFIKGGMIGKCLVLPMVTTKGLSFRVEIVQFLKDDGVRFAGGTRNPADLLAKLEEDAEEEVSEETEDETVDEAADKAIGNHPRKISEEEKQETKKAATQKGKAAALARL